MGMCYDSRQMTNRAPLDYESRLQDTTGALPPKAERQPRPPRYAHVLSSVLALLAFWGNVVTYWLEHDSSRASQMYPPSPILRVLCDAMALAGIYYGDQARHFHDERRNVGKFGLITNICLLVGMAIWWIAPMFTFVT